MALTKKTKAKKRKRDQKISSEASELYALHEDIIEYFVRTKSRNYSFDTYGPDDIAQEIRIICLRVLPKFDSERGESIKNFLGRCVDNGLKNLKRDKYVRVAFPEKKKYEKLEEDDDSEEAQEIRRKYERHQQRIRKKLAIRHAVSIDGLVDLIKNDRFEQEMEYKDLERYLLEQADDSIIVPLQLILSGRIKEVSRREKRRVQAFVRKMLE